MRYCFLRYPEGKFKAVTLSYDDGSHSDLKLIEIINRYGIRSTFNINSGFVGNEGKLTFNQIKKYILDAGHEVAVHGERHIAPGVGNPGIVISDIMNCRKALENAFDCIVRGMAYPDCGITNMQNGNDIAAIKNYIKSIGIVYARTLGNDNPRFMLPEDFLEWMPTAHHENPALKEMVKKFTELKEEQTRSFSRYPRIFYLWGHSSEFAANNNWEILEDFCADISGKDDIWYATNIEIFEYVKAYNELVTSMDGRKIYNPTLYEIWLDADGQHYSIKPGETIDIQ